MDMSRVSACSYPFRQRPWIEALDAIAAAGFKKVDLLGRAPHLSLDPQECDPSAIQAAAQARGLRIANLGTYVGKGFTSEDPAVQEQELTQVRRAIEIAVLFGARSIRVSPGSDEAQHLDRIVPWFKRAATYAAEAGVYMGFETHGGGISGVAERCAELSSKVGSPYFGVLYDPCNIMHRGGDYRAALDIFGQYITHVHLKDGAIVNGQFTPTMLGDGQIDFAWIVRRLDALGYTGDFAAEYELTIEAPETALKKWYATLARL